MCTCACVCANSLCTCDANVITRQPLRTRLTTTQLLEKSFNLDELESGVGGRLDEVYDHDEYSLRMTEEEKGIDANGLSTTDAKIAEATTDTAPASESEPNGSAAAAPAPEGVVVSQDSEAAS